jgi:hypothetical protein
MHTMTPKEILFRAAMSMTRVIAITCCIFSIACSSVVPTPTGVRNSVFPTVRGNSLSQQKVIIPDDYRGEVTLLLIGYVQRAQFDIDRWILGVLQADIPVKIVEVPTIAGMLPQMVQSFIDNGMRSGIPKSDWASVVTVYEDAPAIIKALGNERPQNSYVVLLDTQGRIVWTANVGYSASQVLELKRVVSGLARTSSTNP